MQNYEVTGSLVTFGLGAELKLSENQAEARISSLKKKKKDIYEVIHPVQFKRGERIGIASDNISKAMLENLKNISDKKSEEDIQYPCVRAAAFGKFNVFDKDGDLLNQKPVKKDEAEKLLAEISENKGDDVNNLQKDNV
jgi:hypothetical protein